MGSRIPEVSSMSASKTEKASQPVKSDLLSFLDPTEEIRLEIYRQLLVLRSPPYLFPRFGNLDRDIRTRQAKAMARHIVYQQTNIRRG